MLCTITVLLLYIELVFKPPLIIPNMYTLREREVEREEHIYSMCVCECSVSVSVFNLLMCREQLSHSVCVSLNTLVLSVDVLVFWLNTFRGCVG